MKSQLLARLTLLSYSLCHGWIIILFVGVTHSMLVILNTIAAFLNRHKKNLRDSKLQTIFSSANSLLHTPMKTARRKLGSWIAAAELLGDNFYPYGTTTDINDPQFKDVFEDVIAKELPSIPVHAILGNHDWLNNVEAQLQYTSIHNQWKMPFIITCDASGPWTGRPLACGSWALSLSLKKEEQ